MTFENKNNDDNDIGIKKIRIKNKKMLVTLFSQC